VLHFPSRYSNPYFYPVSEACAIDFFMDNNTLIKANYDSLLFAKVSNNHIAKINAFKEKNFPAVVEFDKFNKESFKVSKRRSANEQEAYANKGNKLLGNVRNEILTKAGKFNKSEEMAVILAEWGGQLGLQKLDSLKNILDDSLKSTPAFGRMNAVIDYMRKQAKPQKLKVGELAPEFKLKDINGKEHSLSDFRGGYVILDFWASWCGPCKREMPFMKGLYNKYKSKGLKIVGISTDRQESAWKKALAKLNMPYLQLLDNKGVAGSKYFVRGIPYVLLIDPKGIIVGIERGEALEKLLINKLK